MYTSSQVIPHSRVNDSIHSPVRILDAIEQRLPYEPVTPNQHRKMLHQKISGSGRCEFESTAPARAFRFKPCWTILKAGNRCKSPGRLSDSRRRPSHYCSRTTQADPANPACMNVLLDECLPRTQKHDLPGHFVATVPEMGWAGTKDGALFASPLSLSRFCIRLDKSRCIG
jgi:hypothetical protein